MLPTSCTTGKASGDRGWGFDYKVRYLVQVQDG